MSGLIFGSAIGLILLMTSNIEKLEGKPLHLIREIFRKKFMSVIITGMFFGMLFSTEIDFIVALFFGIMFSLFF